MSKLFWCNYKATFIFKIPCPKKLLWGRSDMQVTESLDRSCACFPESWYQLNCTESVYTYESPHVRLWKLIWPVIFRQAQLSDWMTHQKNSWDCVKAICLMGIHLTDPTIPHPRISLVLHIKQWSIHQPTNFANGLYQTSWPVGKRSGYRQTFLLIMGNRPKPCHQKNKSLSTKLILVAPEAAF